MSALLCFYYRDGCHLCEDMWHHLQEIREEQLFDVKLINIDSDPGLVERYGALIPVLATDDRVICNYYLDPVALENYLDTLAESK